MASAGDTALSAWTAWRTPSGSEALQGWGTGEAPTATTTTAADPSGRARRYMDALPFEVSPEGADRVEVEYQVRRWGHGADVPEHGIQTNGAFPVLYRPELSASGFEWDPEGLHLLYSSDQRRGGRRLLFPARIRGAVHRCHSRYGIHQYCVAGEGRQDHAHQC